MPDSAPPKDPLHPLLVTLLSDGLLLPTQATTIHNLQSSSQKDVEYLLLALGLLSERTLQGYLERQFGVETLINPFEIPAEEAIKLTSKSSAGKSRIIPQKLEGGSLYVLGVPPISSSALERIGKKSGLMVVPMVICTLRYKLLMNLLYGSPMDAEERDVALNVLEGIPAEPNRFGRVDLVMYDPLAGQAPALPDDDPMEIARLPVEELELSLFDDFKQDMNLLMEDSIRAFTEEPPEEVRGELTGLSSHALERYTPLVREEITGALSTVQSRDELPDLFYALGASSMRTATLLTCADGFVMGWTGAGLGLLPVRLEGILVPEEGKTFITKIIASGGFFGTVERSVVNKRLLSLMGGDPEDKILGGVVALNDRPVIVVVYVVEDEGEIEAEQESLQELCLQMSSCLVRLIRKRKKG